MVRCCARHHRALFSWTAGATAATVNHCHFSLQCRLAVQELERPRKRHTRGTLDEIGLASGTDSQWRSGAGFPSRARRRKHDMRWPLRISCVQPSRKSNSLQFPSFVEKMHLTKTLAACAACMFACQPAEAIYAKNSPVLQLDAKSYQKLIANSNHTSVCRFQPRV